MGDDYLQFRRLSESYQASLMPQTVTWELLIVALSPCGINDSPIRED